MLEKELNFIKAHLNSLEKENLDVSKANVGWHLDHTVKVINSVFKSSTQPVSTLNSTE